MKKILSIIIIFLEVNYSYTQSTCNFIDHYESFIKIEKVQNENKEYLIKKIVELRDNTCLTNLVNNNINYLDYLLANFSSNSNNHHLMTIQDSLKLQKTFILLLKSDTLFNTVISDLVSKTKDKSVPKDTISLDKLLNIAVKYFSIDGIDEKGKYSGRICAGLNGIQKTEKDRHAQLEAFCFSSIMLNIQGKRFSMLKEFTKSMKELYKLNLGIDNDENLLRAQGAMFIMMRNNENLKNMLIEEYEKKKDYLPFVLKQ